MEEFVNAHIYSPPKVWNPYTHKHYPPYFKDQIEQVLIGQRQPTCILYILPLEILHRIFEYVAPAGKGDGDLKIQRCLKSTFMHKQFEEDGTVIIDCPRDANYYLGKIFLSPSVSYDDIISIKLTMGPNLVYQTDGKGLYLRNYLYEDGLINEPNIQLNILCNSNHQQPFPLYKITGGESEIKIGIETKCTNQFSIQYELLDLETTQERAQAPMLQAFLDKMKPNALDLVYEQMQIRRDIFSPTSANSVNLDFHHSIKTLMWTGSANVWSFILNRMQRFRGSSVMFNKIIPYKYYGKFMPENVCLYTFVSNPTDYRLQFGINASRIDTMEFGRQEINDETVDCYAINANILSIVDGQCGTKYAQ